ncbi:hypothetical protein RB195_006134 [Necator americanus]
MVQRPEKSPASIFPSLSFERDSEGQVQANIPSMMTAEIIMTLEGDLKTDIMADEAICILDNAILTGCCKCAKGAIARVICTSSKRSQAELTCDTTSFTIEYGP